MASEMIPAVVADALVKIFPGPGGGQIRAVDGIEFQVQQGEIFGFLGPNGAGKTTTLEMVEGIRSVTSGTITVLGHNVATEQKKIKPLIGVQLQEQAYFKLMRLNEILDLFATFFEHPAPTGPLLEMVGLQDKAKAMVKELSGGQARRFSIAASLVNDPQVVFLDEPTSGLDPQARRSLWDLVIDLRSKGKTVVLTTHYMEEAETICDRVAVIDHGKIQALNTPLRLIQELDSAYHIRFSTEGFVPEDKLLELPGAVRLTQEHQDELTTYDLEVHDPALVIGDFKHILDSRGVSIQDLQIRPSTLEDVFLHLTGRELRD